MIVSLWFLLVGYAKFLQSTICITAFNYMDLMVIIIKWIAQY
jgi:hypothetical protein